jgi:hypothetical protein
VKIINICRVVVNNGNSARGGEGSDYRAFSFVIESPVRVPNQGSMTPGMSCLFIFIYTVYLWALSVVRAIWRSMTGRSASSDICHVVSVTMDGVWIGNRIY